MSKELERSAAVGTLSGPLTFRIDFAYRQTRAAGDFTKQGRRSIIVRLQLEEGFCPATVIDPEESATLFAESMAQQVALLAVEKDFADGFVFSPTISEIDELPAEIENRLPDLCEA